LNSTATTSLQALPRTALKLFISYFWPPFGVTIPHKMLPLFGTFGLVPCFSVPPFGFCCCWPSIGRSAKFLHTQQKQFRSAKTSCAN
jgi:hypothetical protein